MKRKCKILALAAVILLTLPLLSCAGKPVSTVEITTEREWTSFARKYGHNRDSFADWVTVSVTAPLDLTEADPLGTADSPFNGEIDFCDNLITCNGNLVWYGENVKISNLRTAEAEHDLSGPIVGECSGRVEMENIRVNRAEDNSTGKGMFFAISILVESADTVVLDGIEVFDIGVRRFGCAGGLVSECGTLTASSVIMDDVRVQSPDSSSDDFVSCAGLIACKAEDVSLSGIEIKNCNVESTNSSSGGVVECKKLTISDVKFKDCFIEATRKLSTPSSAAGLVCRGLEEYSEENLTFEDVILIGENSGYVTADGGSEFYK